MFSPNWGMKTENSFPLWVWRRNKLGCPNTKKNYIT